MVSSLSVALLLLKICTAAANYAPAHEFQLSEDVSLPGQAQYYITADAQTPFVDANEELRRTQRSFWKKLWKHSGLDELFAEDGCNNCCNNNYNADGYNAGPPPPPPPFDQPAYEQPPYQPFAPLPPLRPFQILRPFFNTFGGYGNGNGYGGGSMPSGGYNGRQPPYSNSNNVNNGNYGGPSRGGYAGPTGYGGNNSPPSPSNYEAHNSVKDNGVKTDVINTNTPYAEPHSDNKPNNADSYNPSSTTGLNEASNDVQFDAAEPTKENVLPSVQPTQSYESSYTDSKPEPEPEQTYPTQENALPSVQPTQKYESSYSDSKPEQAYSTQENILPPAQPTQNSYTDLPTNSGSTTTIAGYEPTSTKSSKGVSSYDSDRQQQPIVYQPIIYISPQFQQPKTEYCPSCKQPQQNYENYDKPQAVEEPIEISPPYENNEQPAPAQQYQPAAEAPVEPPYQPEPEVPAEPAYQPEAEVPAEPAYHQPQEEQAQEYTPDLTPQPPAPNNYQQITPPVEAYNEPPSSQPTHTPTPASPSSFLSPVASAYWPFSSAAWSIPIVLYRVQPVTPTLLYTPPPIITATSPIMAPPSYAYSTSAYAPVSPNSHQISAAYSGAPAPVTVHSSNAFPVQQQAYAQQQSYAPQQSYSQHQHQHQPVQPIADYAQQQPYAQQQSYAPQQSYSQHQHQPVQPVAASSPIQNSGYPAVLNNDVTTVSAVYTVIKPKAYASYAPSTVQWHQDILPHETPLSHASYLADQPFHACPELFTDYHNRLINANPSVY